jgi:carnitine O-acetyltransferase
VVELADKDAGSQPPIGLLSTQHRDTWAKLRPELLQDPLNKASMAVLDAGTFVLCLDTENPANDEDECNLLLHGGGSKRASANRCFDKSTQVVVFKNGHAGLIGEHSGVDGYPVTVVTDEVLHKFANFICI